LQGKEDKVVPAAQSEKIYLKLKEKNVPAQLILFDGEGHGFRKADSIERCLEAELQFYRKILASL
jgi:dipeptidyl aminopeptidase/acylaminoacyl peptidase